VRRIAIACGATAAFGVSFGLSLAGPAKSVVDLAPVPVALADADADAAGDGDGDSRGAEAAMASRYRRAPFTFLPVRAAGTVPFQIRQVRQEQPVHPEQPTHPERRVRPRIVAPVDGQLISRHEPAVETHDVPFVWETVDRVKYHLVSLFDSTRNAYLVRDLNIGTGTVWAFSDNGLSYGHSYVFTVVAVTGEVPTWATIRFAVRILPELTDPIDLQLDRGLVSWSGCSQELLARRELFVRQLAARGWGIAFTSAARTLRYQEHLYLAVHNVPVGAGRAAERAMLASERGRHGLGTTVARPAPADPHVRGEAFDARVFDSAGRPLNARGWRDARLEALANSVGLRMLPPRLNDSVHFQVELEAGGAS
jgi:hypothetical protein